MLAFFLFFNVILANKKMHFLLLCKESAFCVVVLNGGENTSYVLLVIFNGTRSFHVLPHDSGLAADPVAVVVVLVV